MKNLAPYIVVRPNKDETTDVYINDWELFDFVDDYLTENCDVEFEYFSESKKEKKTIYTMCFSNKYEATKIEQFLSRLDIEKIKEIYSLNNTTNI